ncbi:hypothetical protein F4604DRAFT_1914586 [Suillus subluteus]|nr:hypothetical protein F4604DRAFT_1914586 [Suillus subluteus]
MAKNSFLLYMNKLKWPKKHQRTITMFFMNIVSHPQRAEPYGERALPLYAACVRRDWHDTLALDNAFDISVFNTTLLKNLAEEQYRHRATATNPRPHHSVTKLALPPDLHDPGQGSLHATHQGVHHLETHHPIVNIPAKTPNDPPRTNTLFRAVQHLQATMPALYASAASHTTSTNARATSSGTTKP